MVGELQDVKYISQLKKNLNLVGTLEAQGLRGTLEKAFSRCSVAHRLSEGNSTQLFVLLEG